MPEMWDAPTEPGAFALPGDEQRYGTGDDTPAEPTAAEEAPAAAEEAQPDEGRARNADGTFAAKEADGETPTEETPPADGLIGGKFKTTEDLLRSYQELERQRGLDAAEKGELRQIRQQYEAMQEQLAQLPQQLAPRQQYDYDTLIDQNPAQAAQMAYDEGNVTRMQQAIGAWEELSPGTPAVWAQNLQLQDQMRQQQQDFESRLGPMQERTQQGLAEQAMREFSRTHPDLDDYREAMVAVAEQSPHLAPLLQSDDPGAKMQVLDYLYTKAKDGQARGDADNLAQALRNSAQDVARAEGEAAVVSTSQRTTEPEPPSVAQQIGQEWEDRRRPFDEGWNLPSG